MITVIALNVEYDFVTKANNRNTGNTTYFSTGLKEAGIG